MTVVCETFNPFDECSTHSSTLNKTLARKPQTHLRNSLQPITYLGMDTLRLSDGY
jgi:hypothetical protein